MSDVLTIAGSPSAPSRSGALLALIRKQLERQGLTTDAIAVRDLNAEDLLRARVDGESIQAAIDKVQQARSVIIATPIYKAAYAGVLKAFLDLLPPGALTDKPVLPIATGGSPGHLLAIDYSLKPVLGALGAQYILGGLYVLDAQIQHEQGELLWLDPALEQRLQALLGTLVQSLGIGRPAAAPDGISALRLR